MLHRIEHSQIVHNQQDNAASLMKNIQGTAPNLHGHFSIPCNEIKSLNEDKTFHE